METSAQAYHQHTSYSRYKMQGHSLDWANQPDVFKDYPDLPFTQLPDIEKWPDVKLSALLADSAESGQSRPVSFDDIARITTLTHALTAKARMGGTDFYFRSVASAGALYPFEVYVAVRGVDGLKDGLYYHSVARRGLYMLREGDAAGAVETALPQDTGSGAQVFVLVTAIFFRSSWKYRDRAYRYHLLDSGHLLDNLVLAGRTFEHPITLSYDFDDGAINDLSAIDTEREGCLAVGYFGAGASGNPGETAQLTAAAERLAESSRVSAREQDYPAIRDIHAASITVPNARRALPKVFDHLGIETDEAIPLSSSESWPEAHSYPEAVLMRRSSRNFAETELPEAAWRALLNSLCSNGESGRIVPSDGERSVAVGFLAAHTEGLESGFYLLDREARTIHRAAGGDMMSDMAAICLGQGWLAHCALHVVFLSDIPLLEETGGRRTYRYAMLTAGRLGQRLYLAATALRLGCCGIGAFYDDEAKQLLKLNQSSSMLYLVAAGPLKKRSQS